MYSVMKLLMSVFTHFFELCYPDNKSNIYFVFLVTSGNMAAVITNTTIEIKIPDRLLDSVYGPNGSNLARLRQVNPI